MSEVGGMCGRCSGTASWLDISGMRRCLNCEPPQPATDPRTKMINRIAIWAGILIAIGAVFFVVMMFATNRKAERAAAEESGNRELTMVRVHKIANQSFARWSIKNPDKTCPESLLEVVQAEDSAARSSEVDDTWGRPLRFMCGAGMPAEARGIAVYSIGADRRDERGLGDDIRSW